MNVTEARQLLRTLETHPGLREDLLRLLQDPESSTPATPAAPPSSPPATTGSGNPERERLLLEALRQMARNTENQTRAIAHLARGVGAIQGTARSYREWQGVWRDAEDIGRMLLVGGAITGCALFALILTLIILKNALVNALSQINPFHREEHQAAVQQFQTVDTIPTLAAGGSVLGYAITSGFGSRTHPITGQVRQHDGVDIGLNSGTPLYAASSTAVECRDEPDGLGTTARYSLDDQRTVILGHLSQCVPGSATAGEAIAYSGNSGLSSGPHLHVQVEENGKPVVPTIDLAIATLKALPLETLNTLVAGFYPAIVGQESNGDHRATNDDSGDLAIGQTQVMDYNIAAWSQQALGKAISQDDFLHSPDLQKQISLYEMFQIAAEQHDPANPEQSLRKMAAVWYSGDASRESDYSPIPNQPDSPSVGAYVDQVMARIKGDATPAEAVVSGTAPTPSPPSAGRSPDASVLCVHAADAEGQDLGCGAGVAVSQAEIVTNAHVVEFNGASTRVETVTGKGAIARLIRTDPTRDLALLRVESIRLIPARWGDSAALQPGATVTAIGYPHHQRQATPLQLLKVQAPCDRRGGQVSAAVSCIQVSKGLHPGNSGGALVNSKGEVIGINRAIHQATGLGVAIPAATVQQFIEEGRAGS